MRPLRAQTGGQRTQREVIKLVVVYCMVLNPTMCKELEMVPDNYRPITSMMDCLMGGAIGSTSFVLEHTEWLVKGWRCKELDLASDAMAGSLVPR